MNVRPLLILASLTIPSLAFAQAKPDPNQPATTSGGLYTLETFPLKEIERTLTMTEGVFELKPALRFDFTKDQTFETWTVLLDARYGLKDTLELQAGTSLTLAAPEISPGIDSDKPKSVYVAGEIALKYDMVDARLALELPLDPDFLLDIVAGLPVRIRLNPSIAIIGLERVLIIHTMGPGDADTPKPDLNISAAAIVQIMDQLAVFVRGSIFVPEFNQTAAIPVEVSVQYSVSNILDIGIHAVLPNLRFKNPVSGDSKPFDQRYADLFVRFRFGR